MTHPQTLAQKLIARAAGRPHVAVGEVAVPYTHLTLPTICSV